MFQELQEKGKLTDQEFADTNAAALKEEAAPSATHAKTGLMAWRVKVLLFMALVFLGSI